MNSTKEAKRWQFSLRRLLVAITLFSVPLGLAPVLPIYHLSISVTVICWSLAMGVLLGGRRGAVRGFIIGTLLVIFLLCILPLALETFQKLQDKWQRKST